MLVCWGLLSELVALHNLPEASWCMPTTVVYHMSSISPSHYQGCRKFDRSRRLSWLQFSSIYRWRFSWSDNIQPRRRLWRLPFQSGCWLYVAKLGWCVVGCREGLFISFWRDGVVLCWWWKLFWQYGQGWSEKKKPLFIAPFIYNIFSTLSRGRCSAWQYGLKLTV